MDARTFSSVPRDVHDHRGGRLHVTCALANARPPGPARRQALPCRSQGRSNRRKRVPRGSSGRRWLAMRESTVPRPVTGSCTGPNGTYAMVNLRAIRRVRTSSPNGALPEGGHFERRSLPPMGVLERAPEAGLQQLVARVEAGKRDRRTARSVTPGPRRSVPPLSCYFTLPFDHARGDHGLPRALQRGVAHDHAAEVIRRNGHGEEGVDVDCPG